MFYLLAQDKDDTMPKKPGNICLCSSVYDLNVDQYAIRLKRNILTSYQMSFTALNSDPKLFITLTQLQLSSTTSYLFGGC